MEELKNELHQMVDSIDNPKILENLISLVGQYVTYYSDQKRKNEED